MLYGKANKRLMNVRNFWNVPSVRKRMTAKQNEKLIILISNLNFIDCTLQVHILYETIHCCMLHHFPYLSHNFYYLYKRI